MVPPVLARAIGKFRQERTLVILLLIIAALGGLSLHLALQRAELREELAAAEAANVDAGNALEQLQATVDKLEFETELAEAALLEARTKEERLDTTLARRSRSSDERIAKLLSMARRPGANCEAPPELLEELAGL